MNDLRRFPASFLLDELSVVTDALSQYIENSDDIFENDDSPGAVRVRASVWTARVLCKRLEAQRLRILETT